MRSRWREAILAAASQAASAMRFKSGHDISLARSSAASEDGYHHTGLATTRVRALSAGDAWRHPRWKQALALVVVSLGAGAAARGLVFIAFLHHGPFRTARG